MEPIYIYKLEREFHTEYVFVDKFNNCNWTLNIKFPDFETMSLDETHFGVKVEEEMKGKEEQLPEELAIKFINNYDKKKNRLTMYSILMDFYGETEECI